MSQTGYSKVQIYSSSTASNTPSASNLLNDTNGSELGINITDGKLFYKDNSGTVQVLATKGTGSIGGSNTQVQYNSSGALAGSANFTFNGTTVTMANDASIHGLTVGLGGGSVSTNTAVGTSALQANTSGSVNSAFGYQAGYSNTTGTANTYVGQQTGQNVTTGNYNTFLGNYAGLGASGSTATSNTAIGVNAGAAMTTASSNVFIGTDTSTFGAGYSNTSGSYNVAVGSAALKSNTTASSNTAVGYQAGYANTTGEVAAFGKSAASANTTGVGIAAFGNNAATSTTTANYSTYIGCTSGFGSTGSNNTCLGFASGYNSTGASNTFVGARNGTSGSGQYMTTGSYNTILGGFDGNLGGLDIRTQSNYIVLSDGAGNPKFYISSNNFTNIGLGGTGNTGDGQVTLNGAAPSGGGYGSGISFQSNGTGTAYIGQYRAFSGGTTNYLLAVNTSGGVYLNGASATSWSSASDLRLKTVTGTYTQPLTDISQINVIKYTLNNDETKTSKVGVTAQSVLPVVPEAVGQVQAIKGDETKYYSVSYTDLIPICIASIQELNNLVTAQATEIAALKAKVGI